MSNWNPSAVMLHAYIFATALVTGATFGVGFAFIPLAVGAGLVVATTVLG